MISLGTLAGPARSTPAPDLEAVLSALPLPPDINPPTETSLKEGAPLKKLVLGKPVAEGDLRSGFGIRRHPILRASKMHTGVDWAARLGAPILSAGDGTVIRAEWATGYGRRVEIQHADGVVTTYSHMARFGMDIEPGSQVRQGQVIGFVGSTGLSTGPHLHFEVLVNGSFVDPMDIYAPGGMWVAVRVQKKTSPVAGQGVTTPAEPIAELQTRVRYREADLEGSGEPKAQRRPPLVQAYEQEDLRKLKGEQYWAAHERRVAAIAASLRRRGIIR
jgi:murein DD-endopeptidase MepM/ murein hydrolase activator NlpD